MHDLHFGFRSVFCSHFQALQPVPPGAMMMLLMMMTSSTSLSKSPVSDAWGMDYSICATMTQNLPRVHLCRHLAMSGKVKEFNIIQNELVKTLRQLSVSRWFKFLRRDAGKKVNSKNMDKRKL